MGINPLAGLNELRAEHADMRHELLILKVRAERVRRIHQRHEHNGRCTIDFEEWPCRTIRIHNGLDGDDWGDGPGGKALKRGIEE